uniref:Uncharacterized protein n=1 Tax=Anopheles atroparvus TaxID=41427 RepID=A0AAG5DQQ3_ANOAO
MNGPSTKIMQRGLNALHFPYKLALRHPVPPSLSILNPPLAYNASGLATSSACIVEPSLSHTSFGSLTTQFCFDLERGESGADQCRLNSEICVDKEFNAKRRGHHPVTSSSSKAQERVSMNEIIMF